MPRTNQFSAVDPALGYLYQVRSGLLWSLQKLRRDEGFQVSIEVLDDVAFESEENDPIELLQTKHHSSRSASLSDASPDIWNTLRVWIENNAGNLVNNSASFLLVTTGAAPIDSAAHKLRSNDRNVIAACNLLDATALSSTNERNTSSYRAYNLLTRSERIALLEKVIIVDCAPTIADLENELRSEIRWAAERTQLESLLDRLEGWWLRRVIRQLTGGMQERIASTEIEAVMADLRDQFRQDSLPIDGDLLEFTLDEATEQAHSGYIFVKQIEITQAGKRRIASAIRDYYRAFEQRSRWVREGLMLGSDLKIYEKRLIEEWEIVFEATNDELGSDATERIMQSSARSVLAWAERTSIPLRPGVTEPFLCRGSFHMLSDEQRIGWHTDFRTILSSALGVEQDVP